MAVTHHGYNVLKMPGSGGIITVLCEERDAVCSLERAFQAAAIDVPGLNRAASQERFWPSRVGRCEGPPHSYVRMPFGLPSVASAYQHNMRRALVAQEARYHAVLEEMETVFREPPEPPEPAEAQGPGGS